MDRRLDLQILAEIRAMRAELLDLREAQEHVARRLLDRDDRNVGSVLVQLLYGLFEIKPFTAAEVAGAALNDRTPSGQALRQVIGERLTEDGGLRSFGRLLARLDGVQFNGHRLVVDGKVRGVMRWRVSTSAKPSASDTLREDEKNSPVP